MRKILMIVISLFLFQSFWSCSPAIRLYYGVHKPRLESDKAIAGYIEKYEFPDVLMLVPKDSVSYSKVINYVGGVPQFRIYNSAGVEMGFVKPKNCNAPTDSVSSILCTADFFVLDSSMNIKELYGLLRPLYPADSIRFLSALNGSYRYTTISYWTKFTGFLNKRDVKKWTENSISQEVCKVNTVMVNLDYREEIVSDINLLTDPD
jgi:hypothetical protein